jgi:Spy/CpxP family protein refolding chaperone
MRFNKTKKLLKKDEKELESNPLNDIYHALTPEERSEKKEIEEKEEDDLEDIKEKKRKRVEELMKKYK